jgi:uncharacterized membrane protein YgdD (TMEM256/DUF423 family)
MAMQRLWIALGALLGFGTVTMAAMTAHALDYMDPGAVPMVRTAVQIQAWHALAVIGCGLWVPRGRRIAAIAAGTFVVGTTLFCGVIYARAFGLGIPPGIAPVGGSLLLLGWLLFALSALRAR